MVYYLLLCWTLPQWISVRSIHLDIGWTLFMLGVVFQIGSASTAASSKFCPIVERGANAMKRERAAVLLWGVNSGQTPLLSRWTSPWRTFSSKCTSLISGDQK